MLSITVDGFIFDIPLCFSDQVCKENNLNFVEEEELADGF